MSRRCSHVVKQKTPSNHIMVVRGHELLDFLGSIGEYLTYKCWSLKVLKTMFRRRRRSLSRRRLLVSWSGFEEMGVASWHIWTMSHQNSLYIQACLYLHILEYGGWVSGLHQNLPFVVIKISSELRMSFHVGHRPPDSKVSSKKLPWGHQITILVQLVPTSHIRTGLLTSSSSF